MKCDKDAFEKFFHLYMLNIGVVTAGAMIGYGLTSSASANNSSAGAASTLFAGGAAISGALTPVVGVLSNRFEPTMAAYFLFNLGGTAAFAKIFEDSSANYFQVAQEGVGFAFVAAVVAAICTLLSHVFKDPTYSFAELLIYAREQFPGQAVVIGHAPDNMPLTPVDGQVIQVGYPEDAVNRLPAVSTASVTVEEETALEHRPF